MSNSSVKIGEEQDLTILKQIKVFLINASAGGISAGVGKTVAAPLERVKIVLQTAKQNTQITTPYTSGWDCFTRIYKEQGLLSYWKGNLVNVIRYVPTQALNFAFKEKLVNMMKLKEEKNKTMYTVKYFLAGGLAGSISNTLIYPLDYVRTRLAVDMAQNQKSRQFNGIFDCLAKTVKSDGIQGLFRGVFSNFIGIFLYRGCYFGLYDYGKKQEYLRQMQQQSFFYKFMWAQFVTIFASTFAYPSDTIKRKMMMQSNSSVKLYNGTWDCVQKIIQQEGYQGMFKGFGFNCMRSVCGAICLILFDEIQKIQNKNN